MSRFWQAIVNWWRSPSLLDQFESIMTNESDVLELTEVYVKPDPFGRFKRKLDATSG
jgi:hypothetical protein